MAASKERLFRDEAGAALERIALLEQENRVLRAEIARIKPPAQGLCTASAHPAGGPAHAWI